MQVQHERRQLLPPAALLGFGLGAFADGIVLHQLLQWHHLTSSYGGSQRMQVRADGAFHAASWVIVVAGLLWLQQRRRAAPHPPTSVVLGALLVGWGAFHVVDQLLFHLLLQAHHIRPGAHTQLYDWGYTAVGVVLALLGLLLLRSTGDRPRP